MTPILGILASQISGHLVTNSYESISTYTVSGSTVFSIDFNSIPSTFKHLQLRFTHIDALNNNDKTSIRFNSDSGSNYAWHVLRGNGTSAAANAGTSQSSMQISGWNPSGGNSTNPLVGVVDILDYQNTNKNKTVRSLSGVDKNGSGMVGLFSGFWNSTSAVTSLNIINDASGYSVGTQFALYGIRG